MMNSISMSQFLIRGFIYPVSIISLSQSTAELRLFQLHNTLIDVGPLAEETLTYS